MRGAGCCGCAATGGAEGLGAAIGACGAAATGIGVAGAGGATAAGAGATGRGGAGIGADGGGGAGGFSAAGATTTGRGGATGSTGAAGGATGAGAAGLGAGVATAGLAATGGAAGRAGAATASFCCVMALSTSPGREMWDRSILVLISSSPRNGRVGLAGCEDASDEPRKWARTFSASCSSSELECVFFSVTPTIGNTSRMALLLTSSSLARSLIRTLLIRPFLCPALCPRSSSHPHGVSIVDSHVIKLE